MISKEHLIPDITSKMGLNDSISITQECVKELIVNYTQEAGVRKLKELLFEIAGGSIELLNGSTSLLVVVSKDSLRTKYLKRKIPVTPLLVNKDANIGVVNGLWANSLGKGGILHIQSGWYPTNVPFELSQLSWARQ